MPDTKQIYQSFAYRYHAMVAREDYKNNLLSAILTIDPLTDRNVIELGAGTGRVSSLIAPIAGSLVAADSSHHMLSFGKKQLLALELTNWHLSIGVHHALPFPGDTADVIIAGWSFCYAAIDAGTNWQHALEQALAEVSRVSRPNGKLILIESLGTGFETPQAPKGLVDYLNYLDSHGFESTWIRTDYCFKDQDEARDLTAFFFGDDPLPMCETEFGVIVPECTGLWWKTL